MSARLLVAALLLALPCEALAPKALAMDKSEFTQEVNKLWKINDQYGEAAYQKMLARDDLTEGQIRFLERSLIDYRKNKGDDMTGAFKAAEDYRKKYPDQVDYSFLDDYHFFLGQYTATAERVATATEYSEQVVVDTWKLGYWVDALVAFMNYGANSPMNPILKEDMLRTGYICLHDGEEGVPVIPFSVNGVDKPLRFCPQGSVVKVNTPQPYQQTEWQTKIGEDLKRAKEIKAEVKMEMFETLTGE